MNIIEHDLLKYDQWSRELENRKQACKSQKNFLSYKYKIILVFSII